MVSTVLDTEFFFRSLRLVEFVVFEGLEPMDGNTLLEIIVSSRTTYEVCLVLIVIYGTKDDDWPKGDVCDCVKLDLLTAIPALEKAKTRPEKRCRRHTFF